MNREVYVWALIIIAILAVAFYLRLFYQPEINIALGISGNNPTQFYPFQKATFVINAHNNGSSAISNMSLAVSVNGNTMMLYKITLPAGKQTTISYNYSPASSGQYVISVVADPSRLYNLVDRSKSQADTDFSVMQPQNASPSATLPNQNFTAFQETNLTSGGYIISTHIADQYNVSRLALTYSPQLNNFLMRVLNLTTSYVRNLSLAQVRYVNGSEAYSLWIRGYIVPSIFGDAATGLGLSTTTLNTKVGKTTFVQVITNATLCSWYSGGWTKVLAEYGNMGCYALVNETAQNTNPIQQPAGLAGNFSAGFRINDSSLLGRYNGVSESGGYMGGIWLLSNTSFIYVSIANTTGRNSTCFGAIGVENGNSYCTTYLYPASNQIGNFSLVRTTAYKGAYNLSAFALVNTSIVLEQAQLSQNILEHFNVSGPSLTFKSGIVNSCSFNQTFSCNNATYLNGTISFTLTNNMSSTARLNSISCFINAGVLPIPLNVSLAHGETSSISAPCYNITTRLSGPTLGLHLDLGLNYTTSNSTKIAYGSAFIPFG